MIDGGFDGGVEQFDNDRHKRRDNQRQADGGFGNPKKCRAHQQRVQPQNLTECRFVTVGGGDAVYRIAECIDDAPDAAFSFFSAA